MFELLRVGHRLNFVYDMTLSDESWPALRQPERIKNCLQSFGLRLLLLLKSLRQ